jgi:hypothetical protein
MLRPTARAYSPRVFLHVLLHRRGTCLVSALQRDDEPSNVNLKAVSNVNVGDPKTSETHLMPILLHHPETGGDVQT